MASDRRPVRANSKAAGPPRAIPPGMFKCNACGKTLPEGRKQPDNPPEWNYCGECWAKSQDTSDEWRNPGAH